jgi:tetratricopeptide (TPR) repeat protein
MKSGKTVEALLEEILVDANGADEQLWAFRQAFEDNVPMPAEGTVIGVAVAVTRIDYDGHPQQGLRTACRTTDGKAYSVALGDVTFLEDTTAATYRGAYLKWLGMPAPQQTSRAKLREKLKQTKAGVGAIDISKPVDLVVLGIKQRESARCRLPGQDKELTLRTGGLWNVVPGEIVTVMPKKHWSFAGHPYLTGAITGARVDLAALNLTPLKLSDFGMWDPAEHYWGEDDEPELDWEKKIKACGPRPAYEMEQVVPGLKSEDIDVDTDPISQAVERKEAGDIVDADQQLTELLIADLRCLDAHAHLGNLEFDQRPEMALRHYDVGRQIGEWSLGSDFRGVLPWGLLDNRPYLRCLHGYGLCLWRLKQFDEAAAVFDRMLWLNPSDNQGVRLILDEVQSHVAWAERIAL